MATKTKSRRKKAAPERNRGRRPIWSGYLRLSLVSVPVKAYTGNAPGHGEIHLHQVHDQCHSRIKYQKTCPIHGPVSNDEIVSAYEFSKGEYVEIDPEELDKLRSESDKAIQIKAFIKNDELDPLYFNGQTYYLAPDGPAGAKPYVLLHDGMVHLKRNAIVQVVLHGKEQLAMLRPLHRLLVLTMLNYATQIVEPAKTEPEVPPEKAEAGEIELIETLVKGQTPRHFDIADYKDEYTDRLRELIDAKAAGKKIVAPSEEEPVQVINLMDALKKSVALTQGGSSNGAGHDGKPAKKMAHSISHHTVHGHGGRRRKSS